MKLGLLALGLVAASAGLAQVGPGPRNRKLNLQELPPILRLMGKNVANWKYSGTRIVEIRDGAQRKLTTEFTLRDGNRTRTWFPADSPRAGEVIVEDGLQRKFYDPKRNVIIVTRMPKGKQAGAERFMAILGRNFKFTEEKNEKVAGHDARVVTVADGDRVFQRVWIDAQTGVPLKRELYDNVGAKQGYFEFKSIDYTPILRPGDFDINVPNARVLTPYDIAKEFGEKLGITPVFLPRDRFTLENVMRPGQAGQFLHMSYSTEQGMVSLFQAKGRMNLDRMPGGGERRANSVAWSYDGNSFVLMGRMPKDQLEAIARELGKK